LDDRIFREVGLVKDGARRRRSAVSILDQTDLWNHGPPSERWRSLDAAKIVALRPG
jgi:hypothetical protein